jgi:hypothetical protein
MLIVRATVFVLVLLALTIGDSHSQRRSRNQPPVQPPRTQPAQAPTPDQRGTEQMPFAVKILPSENSKGQAEKEEQQRQEKAAVDKRVADETQRLALYTFWLTIFTLFLFVAAITQIGFFWWQLRIITRTIKPTEDAANAAKNAANAAIDQAKTAVAAERAYVTIAHMSPGLDIQKDEKGASWGWVTVRVKNFGRTPARVTDVLLKPIILPKDEILPDIPNYARKRETRKIPKGFIVSNDEIFYGETYSLLPGIEAGTHKFWLCGYVDYIDQFGQRHRGGYARVYDAPSDSRGRYRDDKDFETRNNLRFVQQDGYNYDRPRQKGEGNDWDERQVG